MCFLCRTRAFPVVVAVAVPGVLPGKAQTQAVLSCNAALQNIIVSQRIFKGLHPVKPLALVWCLRNSRVLCAPADGGLNHAAS